VELLLLLESVPPEEPLLPELLLQSFVSVPTEQYCGSSQIPSFAYWQEFAPSLLPPLLELLLQSFVSVTHPH